MHSTPIVVFAHIPLWMVYEKWGWGTKDGEQALAMLKRFGSVTVLNGHIHQVVQKVEGNVAFHTAMSTAFPQPAPGAAPNPGPMVVPAGKLAERARSHEGEGGSRTQSSGGCRFDTRGECLMRPWIVCSIQCRFRRGAGICASVRESAAEPKKGFGSLLQGADLPNGAKAILVTKCADCHSSETRWPVYSRIAPGSWLIERDIVEARKK